MPKSYDQILDEVGSACEYIQSGGNIQDAVVASSVSGHQLAHLSDNDLVIDYAPEMVTPMSSEISAKTTEELELIFQALSHIHGLAIPRHYIDKAIAHEQAHTSVNSILFAKTEYRVMVLKSEPGISFGARPYSAFAQQLGALPKLAIAAATAAPFELSPGDEARLLAMNYSGQADVAHRMRTTTDPRLTALPLPETFRPY